MTPIPIESVPASSMHAELAWQWSPVLVAAAAAAAAAVAAAAWRSWRGPLAARFAGLAARGLAIAILVGMLSGWRLAATTPAPEGPVTPTRPTLSVKAPRIVRLGETACIDVEVVTGAGRAAAEAASVRLVDVDGTTVASSSLLPDEAGLENVRRLRGRIIWRPASAGTFAGSVVVNDVVGLAPEAVSIRAGDEPLRVFLIDRPRFESRFLERHLARDRGIDATVAIVTEDGADRARWPATRAEWSRYDVVVIGGVDAAAIDDGSTAALVEAAAFDGVGIVWCLDAACDVGAIAVSPLGRLLPIRGSTEAGPFTTPHTVELGVSGGEAAWLAVSDVVVDSERAWRSLPSVFGPVAVTAIRPTARVMATVRPAASPGDTGSASPFILVDRAGAARVVAMLAETWRLRQGGRGPLVDRLVSQVIAFAAEPRLAARLAPEPTPPRLPSADADRTASGTRAAVPPPATESDMAAARPLWNHPAILLALLACCSVEWWLRGHLGDAS